MSLSVDSYGNFGDLKPKLKLLIPSSIEYVMGESTIDLTTKILVICDRGCWTRFGITASVRRKSYQAAYNDWFGDLGQEFWKMAKMSSFCLYLGLEYI